MKRIPALLFVFIMLFTLCACGGEGEAPVVKEPELLGRYETRIELRESVIEKYDNKVDAEESPDQPKVADYLAEDVSLVVISEFREDGTYCRYVDEQAYNDMMDSLTEALTLFNEDFIFFALTDSLDALGEVDFVIETKEDVEKYLGASLEDWALILFRAPMDVFVAGEIEEIIESSALESVKAEGKYKAEGGMLWTSEGLEQEIDPKSYKIYEINGNTVKITGGNNMRLDKLLSLPYELVKADA